MSDLKLEIGKTYRPKEGYLITIVSEVDESNPHYNQGYKFEGRYSGIIKNRYYNEQGQMYSTEGEYKGQYDLIEGITTEEDIVNYLWNQPGSSLDEFVRDIKDIRERRFIESDIVTKLLKENRISLVRFTTYAPNIKTTFYYFATEHGRIEILDNDEKDFCGFQIGHIHDPMGQWDVRMEEALKD